MLTTLFRAILSSALRMALPLAVGLPLVLLGRKSIRSRTLITIQKLMMAGMLLSLVLTFLGPLVQVPVSNQLPVPQVSPALPAPSEQPTTLPEAVVGEPMPSGAAVPAPSPWEIVGTLWLCGAAARLALTFTQNARFLRHVQRDSFPATAELSQLELSCGSAIGLRNPPTVMIAPAVSSPMAAGCLRPVIYLPAQVLLLPQEQQRLLLTHELHHCKARDNFWRVFSSILLAVYWFDPLMWALAISFSTQCELCCDENVLSGAPVQTRKLYGGLLLSFATENPAPLPVPSLQSGWKESFYAFKLRIGQIVSLEQKVPGKIFLIGCILIFFLFSGMIGFHQNFTPSEVIILLDNLEGNTKQEVIPRRTYQIRPPVNTDKAYHFTRMNEDGSTRVNRLHFMANTEHEKVTAGCDGVVAAIQTKSLSEVVTEDDIPILLGKYVIIDCGDGISIRYTYLDTVLVEVGQRISTGDVLGTAGHTGSSIGYDDQCGVFVMQDGLMVDPLLFFDISTEPAVYPTGIPWEGAGYGWIDEEDE